jgi:FkbM family methyltransferase
VLIPLNDLVRKYRVSATGVIHLGAHTGEEAEAYRAEGIDRVWWIEGNPDLIPRLRAHVEPLGHHVIQSLVSDQDHATAQFHVTNNFQSSSILELGTHARHHPEVVVTETRQLETRTLESLAAEHGIGPANFMNIDLQGAELAALRGAGKLLADIDYVYTEVNEEEVYENCPLIEDLDAFLGDQGLKRVETLMTQMHWGDAFYTRGGLKGARREGVRTNARREKRAPLLRETIGRALRGGGAAARGPRQ